MLKQLTIAAFAAALLPACVLVTDDTTTSISDSSSGSGTGTGTGTGTESGSSSGTTDTPTGSSTDTPTGTGTSDATTSTTDATTSTTDATTGTTGPSETGKCGWNPAKYYACDVDGGQPGVSDPDGVSPIACADGLKAGEKCDGTDPVSEAGCCTPEGTLYFCDTQTDPNAPIIFEQQCGV